MATILQDSNFGGMSFSQQEIDQAISEFRRIVAPHIGHLANLADKAAKSLDRLRSVQTSQLQQESIARGIINILLATDRFPNLPQFSDSTEIFICLFVRIWRLCDEKERSKIFGQIVSGLKDSRSYTAIYFELLVATIYAHKGNTVELCDLISNEKAGHDFVVRSKYLTCNVEVKTIQLTAGMPFDMGWMAEVLTVMMKDVSANLPRNFRFHVELIYRGPRQPKLENMALETKWIGNQFKEKRLAVESELFEARFREVTPDDFERFTDFIVDADRNGNSRPHAIQLWSEHNSVHGVLTLQAESSWNLPEKIATVINESSRQLPKDELGVLWIQLVGSTPDGGRSFGRLNRMLQYETSILQAMQKRQQRAPGFLGIHLAGDPFSFFPEVGGDLNVELNNIFASSTASNTNSNIYTFSILKSLPSDMGSL